MAATNDRTVTVFGGTGFLGRRVVRHLRDREFPFGLHQGIRTVVIGCSALMIRTFNQSGPTFTMSVQWPMHLLAPTAW